LTVPSPYCNRIRVAMWPYLRFQVRYWGCSGPCPFRSKQ
jgi:hypothetical protein